MPADHQLSVPERAVMLALMAEAREVPNPELRATWGVKLDGKPRLKLNDLKLVTSTRRGRGFAHELTDSGWAWCRRELSAERPAGAGSFGGALYAVLASFERFLARTDLQLADVFQPGAPVTEVSADEEPGLPVETQIRTAYARLKQPGEWLGLVNLRNALPDVSRDDLDAALERMAAAPGVHVQAEINQKALTAAHRAAAVRFGGDDRHLLMIEAV